MKGLNILVGCLVLLILSGCGTFTKMRYSHGFKSNFEFSFRNKTGKVEELKACKAEKYQRNTGLNKKIEPITTEKISKSLPVSISSERNPNLIIKVKSPNQIKQIVIERKPQILKNIKITKSVRNNLTIDWGIDDAILGFIFGVVFFYFVYLYGQGPCH